ncbi:MAG: M48 family metalloprotease [Candidatus Omnitrophota bacterium]
MIYTNFLVFIAAILIFSTAPISSTGILPHDVGFYGNVLLILGFWIYNRYQFVGLRNRYKREMISIYEAKRNCLTLINRHIILALFLFGIEVYGFNLKYFLIFSPEIGRLESPLNLMGLGLFILHLIMVWHWAFRAMGDLVSLGKSASAYIRSNIKFNVAIIIPWVLFLVFRDILQLMSPGFLDRLESSPFFLLLFFGVFLFIFAILAPVIITRLWDCRPLEDEELKQDIETFSRAQGVRFKQILSWNALNGGLVTAGVMGLFYPFRYLMVTPELRRMLDKNEMLGVVSHEVGHVKRKHLFYYLAIFFGFTVLGIGLWQWLLVLILLFFPQSVSPIVIYGFTQFVVPIVFFLLFFRYVFGYFMRSFERQADTYCFESGIDPNYLITSFMKLGVHLEDNGKKPNWHHYNISQRIDFLRQCIDDPSKIGKHTKKVNRSLRIFGAVIIILSLFSFYAPLNNRINNHIWEKLLQVIIQKDPSNPAIYAQLGELSYQMQNWEEAKNAFEKSLELKYNQATVLNNLAWMYLTCPDKKYSNPQRALILAKDAVELEKNAQNYDTLAEAYFQNAMYKDAYTASFKAFQMATQNEAYYKKQMDKMLRYYNRFKNTMTI